jgi:hypothetical protein
MGDGPFVNGPMTEDLSLHVTSPKHGEVEPSREMILAAYQLALANTRDAWQIDED